MSVRVTAVVISHDQPEWLRKTLTALETQTRKVDEIIAVDSSGGIECAAIFEEFKISPVFRRTDNSFGALVSAGVAQAASIFTTPNLAGDSLAAPEINADEDNPEGQHSWFWLLHDDSVAEPDTLEKLLAAADLSPSVALLGPKQVSPEQPNLIVQQGLTLTKLGGIFSLVDNELDQAQHDSVDDVMAVGSAGALMRTDLYRRLQGFDRHAPNLASDIDFSIRARLSGYRVVVVPQARILHATMSLKGLRPRRWLQGSPEEALRRAEIHLQLAYLPVLLVWMYAVLLPFNGAFRALWRVATKQPAMVAAEISAAFWGFVTIPVRLLSRAKVELNLDVSVRSLWPLRASFGMVRHRNRMLQEHVADDAKPTAPAKPKKLSAKAAAKAAQALAAEASIEAEAPKTKFASAGGWFVFLALAISNWQLWPTNFALVGGSSAPLSGDWFAVASRAGASWQNLGLGVAAPSDPFNWLLAGVSALWFITPSLALAVAVFLSRSIAFAAAWYAFGLVSKKTWIRLVLAVAYALWPAFVAATWQGRIGAIFAWMLLPWLVLSVSKLLVRRTGRLASGRQASWIGVSGLLFAAIAVAAPSLGLLLLLALVVITLARPKRVLALAWVAAPAVALFAPYAWFMTVVLKNPFGMLADPAIAVESQPQQFWQILVGLPNALSGNFGVGFETLSAFTLIFVFVAVLGWFSRRAVFAAALTLFAVLAAAVGFVLQSSWFAPLGVHGSAASASAMIALAVLLAAGLALDDLAAAQKRAVRLIGLVAIAGILAGSLTSVGAINISQKAFSFSDGRTEPAIVAAEASQGSHLRTLEIAQLKDNSFEAKLVAPNALKLESNSTAYKYVLAEQTAAKPELKAVDELVANLVSANGKSLASAFADANIGFVLVSDSNSPDLSASLNSVSELEPVGQTEFGWLWRVRDAKDSQNSAASWRQTWSLTKGIQLAVVIIFLLLAIPGAPKRRAKNTGSIFGEQDFDDADLEVSSGSTAEGEAK